MPNNYSNDRDKNKKIPKLNVPQSLDVNNYVDLAETVVLHLLGKNANCRFKDNGREMELKPKSELQQNQNFYLTTTKIRNLLSLLNVIQQMVKEEQNITLEEVTLGKIQYFKMRCAYEAGRDPAVKDFVKKANIMDYINNIGDSKKEFELFFHYVEALVAYHRFYGGKNN